MIKRLITFAKMSTNKFKPCDANTVKKRKISDIDAKDISKSVETAEKLIKEWFIEQKIQLNQ